MYEIIQKVIREGNYRLSALLKKIDSLWVEGKLSEEERQDLKIQSRNSADLKNDVEVLSKLQHLERRIKALESKEGDGNVDKNEVEPFVVGKWYYTGDQVLWNNKLFCCIAPENTVCIWSPDDYPAYWSVIWEEENV